MKKTFLIVICLAALTVSHSQVLKKIADRAKQRMESKTNEKVDTKVDKTVDTVFSKTERTVSDVVKGNPDGDDKQSDQQENNTSSKTASLKVYTRYDFVPGERIIVFEDFAQDGVGDFPAKWNTNAAGEINTIEGKQGHWFSMGKAGFFMPEFIDSLPEDFTLEFDILIDRTAHSWGINTSLAELEDRNKPEAWRSAPNRLTLNLLPGTPGNGSTAYDRRKDGTGEGAISAKMTQFDNMTRPVHVAFWRQKERLRIYLNEEKSWDIPKAFLPAAKLNALVFDIQNIDNWHYLISNLRLAVGAPDTRKKILEQNKWVTHGILFDVNSDKIKPESYGTLKEMANVLKEYADLKVKIVGHTDGDGNDASNLDLSKRRAAAVKESLAKEFGIDESRMETDGKGESEPIDKNDTSSGKANNRRVEFIKI